MADSPVIIEKPSPNFNERTRAIDTILLHYTAAGIVSSLDHLCDPQGTNRVSAHYVIAPDGTILRLVDETKRAWHAGISQWNGLGDVNSSSIGIEIVNLGERSDLTAEDYPDQQIAAVIDLCKDIMTRHTIRHVIGHSDVSVGRKIDPGFHFPWKKLAEAGIGFWTDDLIRPKLGKKAMLEAIGYEVKDVAQAFTAFQRHFYPEGILNLGTSALYRLAAVHRAKMRGQF